MNQMRQNVPLDQLSSWKVGGVADHFIKPISKLELKQAYTWAVENNHAVTILSGGTNVLISDNGVSGLTIHMQGLNNYQCELTPERFFISAEAGFPKVNLMRLFMKYKLAPALFLSGLPGDVGGGVYMNAGVSENRVPREFFEIVDWVEVLKPETMKFKRYFKKDIQWNYRSTQNWQPGIIYQVGFSWDYDPIDELSKLVMEANRLRKSKQPLERPSCGSTFKNPEAESAGALIESCGLKGFSIGGIQVSEKHANFLVNTGGGTAQDVSDLIEHIQKVVLDKKSIELKTEVIRLGRW